jgi:hypothetical protein
MPAGEPPTELGALEISVVGLGMDGIRFDGQDPAAADPKQSPTKKTAGMRGAARTAKTHAARHVDEAVTQHKENQAKFTSSTGLPHACFHGMVGLAAWALATGVLILMCWTVIICYESSGRGPAVGVCFAWAVGTVLFGVLNGCCGSRVAALIVVIMFPSVVMVVFAVGIEGGARFATAKSLADNPPIANAVSHRTIATQHEA